jgi:hypothetical protein
VLLTSLTVDLASFAGGTGWALKPEGACKGEICVPLPDEAVRDGVVDVAAVAERLGMPLVRDEGAALWALGPESGPTGRALTTAVAPELELPDVDGNPFKLSSLLGQKVLLVAWATW